VNTPTKKKIFRTANPKSMHQIAVYFPDAADVALLRAAAKREGRSLSNYCYHKLAQAARNAK
jgi:hypothetical protein